ncbi:hypothetical protein [Evansella tamaricis]|uniref:Uncharacterized protein n=1 Tax=Evansella tamaricis TaxID=2069301 RepID=A0ABS6JJ22_9BACI|nr:hypothetical protein [Evansella tamaricis]MBU9713689.1 hypothetical protein [Evansella tamaricis]
MKSHSNKKSKAERARNREIIDQYHKKTTEDALQPLYEHFIEWKNGNLPYYKLTEHIHEFHKLNQKIWSRFNHFSSNDDIFVFQAKKELGLLTEEEKEEFKHWLD